MAMNLSSPQIISYSIIGFVVAGIMGTGLYYYKHANDPKDNIGDHTGIFVRNHSIGSSVASGVSRRKKSHNKRKQSRRK